MRVLQRLVCNSSLLAEYSSKYSTQEWLRKLKHISSDETRKAAAIFCRNKAEKQGSLELQNLISLSLDCFSTLELVI
jgi:hypothetical protein